MKSQPTRREVLAGAAAVVAAAAVPVPLGAAAVPGPGLAKRMFQKSPRYAEVDLGSIRWSPTSAARALFTQTGTPAGCVRLRALEGLTDGRCGRGLTEVLPVQLTITNSGPEITSTNYW